MTRTRVLFLCTGNSCRSQMAEGWLRHLAGDCFEAFSAGIEAHGKNPHAIATMREVGVDISGQESETTDPELLKTIDLLVTVCSHADRHCPVVYIPEKREHWPFTDPASTIGSEEEVMNAFRCVRDQIRVRIETFVRQAGFGCGQRNK